MLSAGLVVCLAAGCTQHETIDVDGKTRKYLVHVPSGEAPREGWPLVLAFHGASSTPRATEDYTGLSELADQEGFIVVYPKGKRRLWNDGRKPDDHDDVAFTKGTEDELVPHEGGELGGRRSHGTMLSAHDSAEHWAALNGCVDPPAASPVDEVEDGTRVETLRFEDCAAQVVLHSIVGGGHTWPGAEHVAGLGPVSAELDASAEMWRFFAEHPAPEPVRRQR